MKTTSQKTERKDQSEELTRRDTPQGKEVAVGAREEGAAAAGVQEAGEQVVAVAP